MRKNPHINSNRYYQAGQHYATEGNENYINIPKLHQRAYENVYEAKSLINQRIDKLKDEMDYLKGYGVYRRPVIPYKPQVQKGLNPNLYSYQFIDVPPKKEKVLKGALALPNIQIGGPCIPVEKEDDDIGIGALLALLMMMRQVPQPQPIPPVQPPKQPTPKQKTPVIIPKKITPKPIKKKSPKAKTDWWQKMRYFCRMHQFYQISNRYGKFSSVRNRLIADFSKQIYIDIDTIKGWGIQTQKTFFDEFKVFPDMNLQFSNQSTDLKIQEQSQKIKAIISSYLTNILTKSSKGNDLPDRIQKILYSYIRDKAYFPKKFLTTFEINRLDFNLFGGLKSNSDSAAGMIIAFLLISRGFVHQVLLHPIELFEEFKKFPYIQISCKYVGSILHYLVRDAFRSDPPVIKEILALFNHYRNYGIHNEQIEKDTNFFDNNVVYKDRDELSEGILIPEDTISIFFENEAKWCAEMRRIIFKWACNLGRFIIGRFAKGDKNLRKN